MEIHNKNRKISNTIQDGKKQSQTLVLQGGDPSLSQVQVVAMGVYWLGGRRSWSEMKNVFPFFSGSLLSPFWMVWRLLCYVFIPVLFKKVVPFNKTKAMATIRQELYGQKNIPAV